MAIFMGHSPLDESTTCRSIFSVSPPPPRVESGQMTDGNHDTTWRRVKKPWEAFAKSESAVNRRIKHTTSPDKTMPSELSIGPRITITPGEQVESHSCRFMNKTLRHCSVHVRAFCLQPRAPIGLDLPSTRPHLSPPFSASRSPSANHHVASRAGVGPAQKCVLRPWRRPGSPSMTDNFRSSTSCEEKIWLGKAHQAMALITLSM
ncbi:hypothetical protein BJX62DRAFT_58310 [Aspergillus germanicus]